MILILSNCHGLHGNVRQSRPGAGCDTDQGLTNIMESDTDTDTGSQEQTNIGAERRERYIENIHKHTCGDIYVVC